MSVQVFPDGLPKEWSAPIGAIGLLFAVLWQVLTGVRGFAGLTFTALGVSMSIVYRTGPAPDVQKLFAPLACSGGAGAFLGVTGGLAVKLDSPR